MGGEECDRPLSSSFLEHLPFAVVTLLALVEITANVALWIGRDGRRELHSVAVVREPSFLHSNDGRSWRFVALYVVCILLEWSVIGRVRRTLGGRGYGRGTTSVAPSTVFNVEWEMLLRRVRLVSLSRSWLS